MEGEIKAQNIMIRWIKNHCVMCKILKFLMDKGFLINNTQVTFAEFRTNIQAQTV